MTKKIGIISAMACWLFSSPISLLAQQYPLFSNYVTNGLAYNPALAGANEQPEARIIYRTQWVNVEGAPQTMIGLINGKLKSTSPFAAGLMLYSDEAGFLAKTGVSGMFSVNRKITEAGTLSVGVSGGYYNVKLKGEQPLTTDTNDKTIENARNGVWSPDLSLGIQFRTEKGLFAGISVPQMIQKTIIYDPDQQNEVHTKLIRHYYGILGYGYKIKPTLTIEPSVLVKYAAGVPIQIDGSIRAIMNDRFWIGASYRSQDAMSLILGVQSNKLLLSYAYDVTTSKLANTNAGSHELTLAYRFGSNKKCKDTDGDGICDKEDECIDQKGTKANKGCPDTPKESANSNKPCPDADKDGICDKDDVCPDLAGKKEFKGCPPYNDRDGDGLRDDIDKCPDIPGSPRNEGCPTGDRDKDGVPDESDPCPDVYGDVSNNGCPATNDRDKDGVPDLNDPCPDLFGPQANRGCPDTGDRDGDGIPDASDPCPNTYGTVNGCPQVSKSEQDLLDVTIRNLYFDTDKWIIRPNSYRDLNNLAKVLKEKKTWKVRITGHADPRGNEEHNLMLSKNRAYATKNYLISKGVPPNLLIVEFFGSKKNDKKKSAAEQLQMGRRVELKYEFE